MKKFIPAIISAAGAIPLMFTMPYIINAWLSSKLDRWDWGFPVLFVITAGITVHAWRNMDRYFDRRAIAPLLVVAAIAVLMIYMSIYAILIFALVILWWCLIWLAQGWPRAYRILPPFAILSLMTTSSGYWIGYFLNLPETEGVIIKFLLSALFCIWGLLNYKVNYLPRPAALGFAAAVALAIGIIVGGKNFSRTCQPLLLDCTANFADFLGRKQSLDPSFARFFQQSEVHDFVYADTAGNSVSVLEIKCGDNVHEIHPASHCMRSSGWEIVSEQLVTYTINGQIVQVTEIIAKNRTANVLIWSWFSNDSLSTGSFLNFRRLWNGKAQWRSYQVSTSIRKDREQAEKLRYEFISAFPKLNGQPTPDGNTAPAEPAK